MRLKSSVFQGFDLEWSVVVSPKTNTNKEELDIFRQWAPPGENAKVLIYAPKISVIPSMVIHKGMTYPQYNREKKERGFLPIPIDSIYIFINLLEKVYKELSNPKLFTKDPNGYIMMDKNVAKECSRKMKLYSGDIVVSPAVFAFSSVESFGVTIMHRGIFVGSMTHKEIREFCEIIHHLDIQVYSLLLNIVEQNFDSSNKLERGSEDIRDIRNFLTILTGKDINKFTSQQNEINQQPPVTQQFQWNNLPMNNQGVII